MTTGKCVTKFKCKFIFPISFLRRLRSAWDFFCLFHIFVLPSSIFCQGNLWDIWRRRQHVIDVFHKRILIKHQVRRAHIKMCLKISFSFLSTDTGNLMAIQHKKAEFSLNKSIWLQSQKMCFANSLKNAHLSTPRLAYLTFDYSIMPHEFRMLFSQHDNDFHRQVVAPENKRKHRWALNFKFSIRCTSETFFLSSQI